MGSSKRKTKKQLQKHITRTVEKPQNAVLPSENRSDKSFSKEKNKLPKPASMQQVLQCLQNKCKVEVENIDYLLNGRKTIRLTELPEWYYSDDAYGFDYLLQELDPTSPKSSTVDLDIEATNSLLDADINREEPLDIKIVDTFSLANSQDDANVTDTMTKTYSDEPIVQKTSIPLAESNQPLW